MSEEETTLMESPAAEGAQESEQTQEETPQEEGQAAEDEQEAPATSEAAEGSADQSVPYSRFAEVYRKQKEAERELQRLREARQSQPSQPAAETGKPNQGDYESYEDYIEAIADWKWNQNNQKSKREQAERQRQERFAAFDDKIGKASVQDPNFGSKAYIPEALLEHFMDVRDPVSLAYHFGKNPGEAQRIIGLPPIQAAIEIGRVEAGLNKTVTPRTKTKAPAPTSPVGSKAAPTIDPNKMSAAEWIAYRNRKEFGGGT